MKQSKLWLTFLGVLTLFLAWRAAVLYYSHPYYLLYQPADELYRGTLALEMFRGSPIPYWDYGMDTHSGGWLVVAALACLLFKIVGIKLLALKLVTLGFLTMALGIWFWTLVRHFNFRIAVLFSLLFIFPPHLFTIYSFTMVGDHAESIFFTALSMALFFEILYREKRSFIYPGLLGLTAGFGLWFNYSYGVTILAMIFFGLIHFYRYPVKNDKAAGTRLGILAVSFIIGFSPWILMNARNGLAGLNVNGTYLWDYFKTENFFAGMTGIRDSALFGLLKSFAPGRWTGLPSQLIVGTYAILFFIPLGFGAWLGWSERKTKTFFNPALFCVFYCVLFLFLVQWSDFNSKRYWIVLHPFLFFLTAASLDKLSRVLHRSPLFILIPLLFLGGLSSVFTFSKKHTGWVLRFPAFSYRVLANQMHDGFINHPEHYRPLIKQMEPYALREFAFEMAQTTVGELSWEELAGQFAAVPRIEIPHYEEWLVYFKEKRALAIHRSDPEENRDPEKLIEETLLTLPLLPVARHKYVLQGVGQALAQKWFSNPLGQSFPREFLENLPPNIRNDILIGVGAGFENRNYFETLPNASWLWQELKENFSEQSIPLLLLGRKQETKLLNSLFSYGQ